MHARVMTLGLGRSPIDIDVGIKIFRTDVVPFVREEGKGAILLVNRQTGEVITITLWDDEQKLLASERMANAMRDAALDQVNATEEPKVGSFEVAVFEL